MLPIQIGHIDGLFPLHHIPDSLKALIAGGIIVQEAGGFLMRAYIIKGFVQIVYVIKDNDIACGYLTALHHLPGQEVKESFEDGNVL